jgi:hypothetical protein
MRPGSGTVQGDSSLLPLVPVRVDCHARGESSERVLPLGCHSEHRRSPRTSHDLAQLRQITGSQTIRKGPYGIRILLQIRHFPGPEGAPRGAPSAPLRHVPRVPAVVARMGRVITGGAEHD